MTNSHRNLIAVLTTAAVSLTRSAALAKNGGNGGNNGNSGNHNGSFKLNFGGSSVKSFSSPTKSISFNNPTKSVNFNISPKSITFLKKDNCDNHDCHRPCYDGRCYPYYRCYPS